MPVYSITDMAKGADAAMQMELARPAAETALAQAQANVVKTQQENELTGYKLEDRRTLAGMVEQPSQDTTGLGQVFTAKQKIKAGEDKIAQLKAKRDAVKYDDQLYETYNSKVKAEEDSLKALRTEQAEAYKTSVLNAAAPVLAAVDQESWTRARPLYARAQVEAMKQVALDNGQPEPTPQELQAAYNDILKGLPEKYGPSAENMKRSVGIQIGKLKDVLDIEREERDQNKAARDAQKTAADINKINADIDKAIGKGNTVSQIKELTAFVNTQSNIINRDTEQELSDLEALKTQLEDKYSGFFSSPDEKEQAEIDSVDVRIKDVQTRRAQAQKLLEEGQKRLKLVMGIAKEEIDVSSLSPDEKAAYDWATANPEDPKAAEILEELSGK